MTNLASFDLPEYLQREIQYDDDDIPYITCDFCATRGYSPLSEWDLAGPLILCNVCGHAFPVLCPRNPKIEEDVDWLREGF